MALNLRRRVGMTGAEATERTRPLARLFTYVYVSAVLVWGGLSIWALTSFDRTLNDVEDAKAELAAVSEQAVRLQQIRAMAQELAVAEDGMAGRVGFDYDAAVKDFRVIHIGLTEGAGTSELPGPSGDILAFWTDADDRYGATVDAFIQQADSLANLLGVGNEESLTTTNDFIQASADPVTGDIAAILDAAREEYAGQLDDRAADQRSTNQLLLVVFTGSLTGLVFFAFRPMARRIHLETTALAEAEKIHRENNERQTFRNQLNQALEVTDSEDEILERVGIAFADVLPEHPTELLLADSSNAHLRQAQTHPLAGAPNCPVDSPWGCAAIRRGTTVTYETSRALNVCPKLTQHEGGACSAVCAPVTFMGRALGVLHVKGRDLEPPTSTTVERLNVIASETGNRLGTLRATQQTELQASTDGLTGLPNRRTLESKARDLVNVGRPFAVAMADLDHFKDLNDTYGHEAGDRALRLFSKTLRSNLRPDDTAARYGGEEFVLILPNTDIVEAKKALDRLRVTLAGDIAASGSVPFTASWGVTTSDAGHTFDEMVQVADEALYAAKRAGRNRVIVGGVGSDHPALGAWDGDGVPEDVPEQGETLVLDDNGVARSEDEIRCPACKAVNPDNTKFCLSCGENLTEVIAQQHEDE